MQKFLVIQTAFIGDVVLATALVEKLHQFYPQATIDFAVRKGNEALLIDHPFLNEILVWNKRQNKYANLIALFKRIRKAKYTRIINVQRYAATGFLTAFSGAGSTAGFNKNPLSRLFTRTVKHVMQQSTNFEHEVARNQQLIADITDTEPAKPRLYPSATNFKNVQEYKNGPYICIAPSSVWFTKRYPLEKWIELVNTLPAEYKVYVLGALGDKDLGEQIRMAATRNNVTNLCGKCSFLNSAALQQTAAMNYVNNSGPLHFASAVNAPVAAIYCSTVLSLGFGPLSDKSFIVKSKVPLSCRPCGLHGYKACPLKHFKCALTIENQQLLNVLNQADI